MARGPTDIIRLRLMDISHVPNQFARTTSQPSTSTRANDVQCHATCPHAAHLCFRLKRMFRGIPSKRVCRKSIAPIKATIAKITPKAEMMRCARCARCSQATFIHHNMNAVPEGDPSDGHRVSIASIRFRTTTSSEISNSFDQCRHA